MKRRLIVVLACLAMCLTFAAVVNAGTQGSGCGTFQVDFYENAPGDTSDNNDLLITCGNQVQAGRSNLGTVNHTLPGDCQTSGGGGSSTWNDCGSSVRPWMPAGYKLCWYINSGYSGSAQQASVSGTRVTISLNDTTSSYRFRLNIEGC